MAIYHASTKPVSRAAGRSATAAAAYRAAARVVDRRTGEIHDYRKKGGVVAAGIVMPDGSRATHLREQLWNAAEDAEKRKDGRVAREWVIALPDELNNDQRIALAAKFAMKLAATYGVAADLAVHEPSRKGDDRNHHAHILLTTRQAKLTKNGIELGDKASIELSDKARKERGMKPAADDVKRLRALWADMANAALAEAGHEARIDHRSHAERGIDEMPSVHLGPTATAIKRKGKKLDIEEREREHWEAAKQAREVEMQQARAELDKSLREVTDLEYEAQKTGLRAREAAMAAQIWADLQKPAVAPADELQQGAQRIALAVRNAARAQCCDEQTMFKQFEQLQEQDPLRAEERVQHWSSMSEDDVQRLARERAEKLKMQAKAAEFERQLSKFTSAAPRKSQDRSDDRGLGM